ncbi:hypothetical protein [Hyalangium versicolor]|uniref:hypothetical protein n=1 Tax=Hyalangium versicolor TaxID=2861190 RepID=UPI001CD02434|nr:hypothetical protein [Hyalangium versicolor]
MSPASPLLRAGIVLATTLLPLSVFASPLRLQLLRCDSSITDIPELSAQTFEQRTTYGLAQAVQLEKDKAQVVSAGDLDGADLLVMGKMGRSGTKFRLVYVLQTNHEPKLHTQLTYEFSTPRLGDRGVTVMAQDIITSAVKLEEARKTQAAMLQPAPAPVVASAPTPTPSPAPVASTSTRRSPIPAPETSSESLLDSAPEETSRMRQQPLIVVHTGLAGLWGNGTKNFGLGAVIEPKWNITDSIAAGFRFDGGFTFGSSISQEQVSASLGASVATLTKGEYLFGDSGVRPFVGLGAGMYILMGQSAKATQDGAGATQEAGRYFGVAPQVGIDFGPVRLAATYNHILGGDFVVRQDVSVGVEADRIQRNYFQLELSGRLFKVNGPRNRSIPRI